MKTYKFCECCHKVHILVPENARPQYDYDNKQIIGYFWECGGFQPNGERCGSSLLHLIRKNDRKIAA